MKRTPQNFAIRKILETVYVLECIDDEINEIETADGSIETGLVESVPFAILNPTKGRVPNLEGVRYIYGLIDTGADFLVDKNAIADAVGLNSSKGYSRRGFKATDPADLQAKILTFFEIGEGKSDPFIERRLQSIDQGLSKYWDFLSDGCIDKDHWIKGKDVNDITKATLSPFVPKMEGEPSLIDKIKLALPGTKKKQAVDTKVVNESNEE